MGKLQRYLRGLNEGSSFEFFRNKKKFEIHSTRFVLLAKKGSEIRILRYLSDILCSILCTSV